jgi:hypothetical protein
VWIVEGYKWHLYWDHVDGRHLFLWKAGADLGVLEDGGLDRLPMRILDDAAVVLWGRMIEVEGCRRIGVVDEDLMDTASAAC